MEYLYGSSLAAMTVYMGRFLSYSTLVLVRLTFVKLFMYVFY